MRIALLLASGCGRIAFDPVAADAGVSGTFGPAVAIDELNSLAEDDDPTLSEDRLEIYFASNRSGDLEIWRSSRASVSDDWDPPSLATELNTTAAEFTPELAPDGLTIFFARVVAGRAHDIFFATRLSRDTPFSIPVVVSELSTAGEDNAAAPAPDLLSIVVTRGAAGDVSTLELATRGGTADPWTTPMPLTEIDDRVRFESQAWLGDSAIYFTSDTNVGEQQLWFAPRTGLTSFGPAAPVVELDVPGSESDPWVTADDQVIYFEHDDDLFVATRR